MTKIYSILGITFSNSKITDKSSVLMKHSSLFTGKIWPPKGEIDDEVLGKAQIKNFQKSYTKLSFETENEKKDIIKYLFLERTGSIWHGYRQKEGGKKEKTNCILKSVNEKIFYTKK